MTDEPRAKQLASLLQAIEDLKKQKADFQLIYKERMEALVGEVKRLGQDILTGQMRIGDVTEEEPAETERAV